MPDQRLAVRLMDEAVTAVAGVLDASVAFRHAVHVVTEQAAEIPDPFPEPIPGAVRISVHRKEERVPALDARVFHVTITRSNRLIRVMAQEA